MLMDDPSDTLKRPRVAASAAPPAAPPAARPTGWRAQWQAQWQARLDALREQAERRPRLVVSLTSLLIYLLIALAYFWWPIHRQFNSVAINSGIPDLGQNLWYLKWWPYALTHGLNPFITYEMWHAFGYNLSWQTSLPGLSLLAYPITATAGVVVAYNLWIILSFALTAWTTFILCYHLTRQYWASLIGGYLFGFSGYMLAQGTGHIHLIVLFPLPLVIYLTLLRREGRISRRRYLLLTPLPLLLLFLVSVEEFALVAIFAYLTLAAHFLFSARERRETLRLAIEATLTLAITALVLAPYLFYMLIGYSKGEVHATWIYSSDALGFFIPTRIFYPLYSFFHAVPLAGGNQAEQDSYLGVPLAALMVAFGVRYWNKPIGKTLVVMAAISLVFTLGPVLWVANVETIPSPIKLAFKLPFIQKSLPIRYAMFLDLIGALMAAVWLAQQVRRQWVKVALGLALIVVLLPNLRPGIYFTPVTVPSFFSTTTYQRYIKPGDIVLMLPLGYYRTDLLWQQATDYAFTLSSGYGGVTPHPEDLLPTNNLFNTVESSGPIPPLTSAAEANAYDYYMEQYIATERVNEIIVQERYFASVSPYLTFLHVAPQHIGGVWYYAVPASYTHATLPVEQVTGERISRPYSLVGAARWDSATHQLIMPAGASSEALETLADTFAQGDYTLTLTVRSAATTPFAYADVIVNGQTTIVSLPNGTTRVNIHVPGKIGSVLTGKVGTMSIRIYGMGGAAFTIGDATLTRV